MDLADKRVLVTGGSGFLGRCVCERLRERGATILLARRSEFDLTDAAAVSRLLEQTQPELLIHLAAEVGGIGANQANPGRYFYANMAMGLNLIEEARRRGVEKFVQVGTVCSYPRDTPVPFQERSLWDGYPEETNAPYGIAKKALLVMLQAYREQYGFPGIYLMPANLYGPGDNFALATSHVIPALIERFERARAEGAQEVTCWGSGEASREFLYVEDCAEAIVLATERYSSSEPVNLGAGREITISELAGMLARIVGFEGEVRWDATRPDGQPRRCLDTSAAWEGFGFRASTLLDDGLRSTVEWYRRIKAWEEPDDAIRPAMSLPGAGPDGR
jgi:GDP-L-fucose synthase